MGKMGQIRTPVNEKKNTQDRMELKVQNIIGFSRSWECVEVIFPTIIIVRTILTQT